MVALEVSDKDLRTIETGPRQRALFTSEEDEIETEQARVLACVTAAVQRQGYTQVTDLVREAAAELALSPHTVLQHIFWLSHDRSRTISRRSPVTRLWPTATIKSISRAWSPATSVIGSKPWSLAAISPGSPGFPVRRISTPAWPLFN